MSKKLTIEFVINEFEKENYTLLTKIYKNTLQKLEYICPNNHQHSVRWGDWKKGSRCPYCYGNAKLTIEFIKKEFEKEGYVLLNSKYKNSHQKLRYICPNGHNHFIRWYAWKQGARCFYCNGNVKPTIEFIKQQFKKEKYILLTKKYKNSYQKLRYICPNSYEHHLNWNSWQQGKRCPCCAGNIKPTIEFIRKEFEKEECVLLTKVYKNAHQKLKYICSNGHEHFIRWNDWQQGHRCPICAGVNYSVKYSGENNTNWKGGISCEPYCQDWTKEFKDYIKERDGNMCLNPDCWGNIQRLSVHHVDYNKKNCEPQNLITLCASCNSRANKDRKWHEAWYSTILQKRYNYRELTNAQ